MRPRRRPPAGFVWAGLDLTGFDVEATDGRVGKIDEATQHAGGAGLVVDTGPWIFGKRIVLPGSFVERVDVDGQTVYVNLTRDEVRNAPEYGV